MIWMLLSFLLIVYVFVGVYSFYYVLIVKPKQFRQLHFSVKMLVVYGMSFPFVLPTLIITFLAILILNG